MDNQTVLSYIAQQGFTRVSKDEETSVGNMIANPVVLNAPPHGPPLEILTAGYQRKEPGSEQVTGLTLVSIGSLGMVILHKGSSYIDNQQHAVVPLGQFLEQAQQSGQRIEDIFSFEPLPPSISKVQRPNEHRGQPNL